MKFIVTQHGKPIFYSNESIIDHYQLVKKVIKKEVDIDEYMTGSTFNGKSAQQVYEDQGVIIWEFSAMQNDWVDQSHLS